PLKRGCYPARSNEWGRSRNLDLDVGSPAFCSAYRAESCALSSIRNHLHIFCHILSEWESYSVQGGRKIEHRRDLVNFPPKSDSTRFVHYGCSSCSLRPTLKRRAQRTKPGQPGSQGASAP